MKVKQKAYAKINLALNVFKKEGEYHPLESLVTTVDLYDSVTLQRRKDDKITLFAKGNVREYVYNLTPTKDNAYKAACLYQQAFNTLGVDIVVEKNIPLSSGMGGSSTLAAAVLNAMNKLFDKNESLVELANQLGSDTAFLLNGGTAILRGRGTQIEQLNKIPPLKILALFIDGGVDTAKCFETFDNMPPSSDYSDINKLAISLYSNNIEYGECKNSLQNAACKINDGVYKGLNFLKSLSPSAYFLTGSGSTVCALFNYEGLYDWAKQKADAAGFNCQILTSIQPKTTR